MFTIIVCGGYIPLPFEGRYPEFSRHYRNNERCFWEGSADQWYILRFTHLDTEAGYDFVQVRNDDVGYNRRFSGSRTPEPIRLYGLTLVTFTSDDSNCHYTGFAVQICKFLQLVLKFIF